MKFHRPRKRRRFENLALSARELAGPLPGVANIGAPVAPRVGHCNGALDSERAHQVAAESSGRTPTLALLPCPLAHAHREDEASGWSAGSLPCVTEDRAQELRHDQRLRAGSLHARRPAVAEPAALDLECFPTECLQIAEAKAAKRAGQASHGLPLSHRRLLSLLRVLPAQIDQKLIIREHRTLTVFDLRVSGDAHFLADILWEQIIAPQLAKDCAHVVADLGAHLLAEPGIRKRFQDVANIARGDLVHPLRSDLGKHMELEAIVPRFLRADQTLANESLGRLLEGLELHRLGLDFRDAQILANEPAELHSCCVLVGGVELE